MINSLKNKRVKGREQIAWGLVLILGVLLYLAQPSGGDLVAVPVRTNTKVITAPQPIQRTDTLVLSGGGVQIVPRENPVNAELLSRYEATKDSLERLKLYREAVTQREYIETLEDSVQKITVKSSVTGTLDSQVISYTTKPVIIRGDSRRLKSFSVGTFALLPTQASTQQFTLGANVSAEFEKVILSVGADVEKRAFVGVSLKLFDSQK